VLWLYGINVVLLVQRRGEMAVLSAVTAVPLHHCAMDIWTGCSVLIQSRGKFCFCLQLLLYCYITSLWLYGLTVVLLVQCRGEMAVLPAVTAVLLHHNAMVIWNDYSVVSTG
jgi:hypothetical protein